MTVFEHKDGQTPIDDFSGLRIKGIVYQWQIDVAEAKNIAKAERKYLGGGKPRKDIVNFSLEWAKKLHKEMFGDVWDWAGETRQTGMPSIGIEPYKIIPELQQCLDDLEHRLNKTDMEIAEAMALFHHRAVQIHPFTNGNGRWARKMVDIYLKQRGLSPVKWPVNMSDTENPIRDEYINALKEADDGNHQPLIKLHKKYMDE